MDETPTDADTVAAADFLRQVLNRQSNFPRTAVVLGSGLGRPAEDAVAAGGQSVPYAQIPGMPQPAVAGHAGRLVVGDGVWRDVVFLQGRVHYYEGLSVPQITFAVRMLHALGIQRLIVTNAAGGIRPTFRPGHLMLIDGHWTFLEAQPRTGDRMMRDGGRLWNAGLRRAAASIPTALTIHSGVYAMMSGPNYETPAEVRMLQHLGADAVGMSTVPEALAAARRNIDVLGVSCITNIACGLAEGELHHQEVTETASLIEAEFTSWLRDLIGRLEPR